MWEKRKNSTLANCTGPLQQIEDGLSKSEIAELTENVRRGAEVHG
jgi:hypothetical protein